jgi:hypothetical protein
LKSVISAYPSNDGNNALDISDGHLADATCR